MAKYRVNAPDGSVFEVSVPDTASEAEVMAYAQAEFAKQKPVIDKPAAVQAGEAIGGFGRQVGLAARYGLEGLGQAAQIFTEPIRYVQDKLTPDRAPTMSQLVTGERTPKSTPLGVQATKLADWAGLPSPEGANERVIGDATRLMAGAGGLGSLGRVAQAAPGIAGKAGQLFSTSQTQQLLSAGGAGLAGGSTREAGLGPWWQAGAALVGGVAAPLAAQGLVGAGKGAVNVARKELDALKPLATQSRQVDQQISLVLRRHGIDWDAIPERIKQPMRAEVAQVMDGGGQLNADAVRRLLDFRTVGATPTRGMLTQDPVQITREMNLAKTGANSTDAGLQRLPSLQNQNTVQLLRSLDDAGAANAPDAFATGERVLGALRSNAAASKGRIDSLYSAARDTSGRSAELDGAAFTRSASQLLDDGLLGGALPKSVETHLNKIAAGEVPFTVDYAEQLKTAIGKLQRATSDGQQRMALGKVREALDATPLRPASAVNPGGLPAVAGTVPPSPAVLGGESIAAFNRARQANRAFMQRVERTPALAAALDDAQPDRFVQQYITGQGATVRDVEAMRRAMAMDPLALQAVKQNIVAHLKSSATNATEDVTKFSPAGYNKALNNIGERKLAAFFSPEEIRHLQAVGRVGTMMTAQPAGTAVNNSNSGALLIGRGLSMLDSIAGKLPAGLDTTINGILRGTQQSQALNVPRSLLQLPPPVPLGQRVGPAAVYSGLLATQPVD